MAATWVVAGMAGVGTALAVVGEERLVVDDMGAEDGVVVRKAAARAAAEAKAGQVVGLVVVMEALVAAVVAVVETGVACGR